MLSFDVARIKNWEAVCTVNEGKEWATVTEKLVWLALPCLFREITEQNFCEVFERIYMHEHASGAYRHQDGRERFFTLEEVHSHIGLKLNTTDGTMAKFRGRLMTSLAEDAHRHMLHEYKELIAKHQSDKKEG